MRGITFILFILFIHVFCLNIVQADSSLAGQGAAVTNLSEYISYNHPKTDQDQPVMFEGGRDNRILSAPSSAIIESDLDTKSEKELIADQEEVVTRTGKILIIKRYSAPPLVFKNNSRPGGMDHEGNSEKYTYAGLLGKTGYHKIEGSYMHDSTGTYLVNPHTDSTIYVQTGDHTIYLIGNKLLVVNNSLNQPFGLVITDISEKGHKVELHCISHISNDPRLLGKFEGWDNKLNSEFKGWQNKPEIGFDLEVNLPAGHAVKQTKDSILMQFSFSSKQWHILVPITKQNSLSERLSCWQN